MGCALCVWVLLLGTALGSSVSYVAAFRARLLLRSVSLYGHTVWHHFPADGHLVFFLFLAAVSKTAMNILYKSVCGHMFSFLGGKYLGMERWVIGQVCV